jgi:hypothetical protein
MMHLVHSFSVSMFINLEKNEPAPFNINQVKLTTHKKVLE